MAGDAIITQPWSADRAPDFLALVGEIRGADAAVVNLEMLFHTYKGYAQADSGGTYMAADPEIAAELDAVMGLGWSDRLGGCPSE